MNKIALTAIGALCLTACSEPARPSEPATDAGPITPPPVAAPPATPSAPAAPASKWRYRTETDEMRGTETKFASLDSENSVPVSMPYTPAPARMVIRQRSTDGLSIMITIDGQFVCHAYSTETVAAKFDDQPITNFRCSEPNSGSPGVLFINSEQRFLAALKSADRVILELPIYEAGPQQVTFDVRGLDW